ncbi:MAG TPA: TetR/AcrR family transcriptional regulator [Sphingomicrobium sp.]|nr:TetR/AcrR family transcriptional regulator [Sphingomicrobium sp.]
MATEANPIGRKPRADAERNRLKLLAAARAAFTAQGELVSMEEVARSAGVGIGTLYRHFPNRNDLVVEVYRNEMARLLEAARNLSGTDEPLEALRLWLLLFVDHLADNIILADALQALVGDKAKDDAAATEQLSEALDLLVARPVSNGEIPDPGIDPLDLLRTLYGVATATPGVEWPKAARRMVDILINGMKAG